MDGEPTPKFRSVARDLDDAEIRTVLQTPMTDQRCVERLLDIVRNKNRTIEKLRLELDEVNEMYERVYEELQKVRYHQRNLNTRGIFENSERARSLEVKRTVEQQIFFENRDEVDRTTKKRIDQSRATREEGSMGTVIHPRPRSKASSIDSNSLNLSSIKPQVGHFESSFKNKEMSPSFARIQVDDVRNQNLRPLVSFLSRRYPEVTDDSQYLPHVRYEFEQLDKNSNFFGVLYRAALELSPEREAATLSAEPKELWRWLKWFFKQYMLLREQLSEQNRFSTKASHKPRQDQALNKEYEELLILLEASSLESARATLVEFKKEALLCRQLSHKVASIFGLPISQPYTILQALDKLHFVVEKERETGELNQV